MDHNFVLNKYSFPALDANEGFELMLDAVNGMIAVIADGDRCSLLSDGFNKCILAPHFTYQNFLDNLNHKDPDLLSALLEFDDKSPVIDILSDEEIDEIASKSYYFYDEAFTHSIDELAFAWQFDATLLSIATCEKWEKDEVSFAMYIANAPRTEPSYLRNISTKKHGLMLRERYDLSHTKSLIECFPECLFSQDFIDWENNLATDLKNRVRIKLSLANEKKFQGGEPLFKTLNNQDGIREIRFGAVQGGAIRILFNTINNKYAVLVGFLKKSNDEGYDVAIKKAKENMKIIIGTQNT